MLLIHNKPRISIKIMYYSLYPKSSVKGGEGGKVEEGKKKNFLKKNKKSVKLNFISDVTVKQ